LAKLEHLRRLLLAEDLDFQMKLARLRQMRETLGQLERIIKEERRELAWSRSAVDGQAELTELRKHPAGLAALVGDQEKTLAGTRSAQKAESATSRKDACEVNRSRELDIQKRTGKLAADPLFANLQPPYLKQADAPLFDAITYLAAADSGAAAGSEQG